MAMPAEQTTHASKEAGFGLFKDSGQKKRPITALVILKADYLDHPANRPVALHPKTTKANSQKAKRRISA
jgi:hypothetical protein